MINKIGINLTSIFIISAAKSESIMVKALKGLEKKAVHIVTVIMKLLFWLFLQPY